MPRTSDHSPPRSSEPAPAAPHPLAVCGSVRACATRATHWGRRPAPGTSAPPGDEPSPAPRSQTPLRLGLGLGSEEAAACPRGPQEVLWTSWGGVRISRSSRSIRFSRRSRRNSSRSAVVSPSLRSAASSSALLHPPAQGPPGDPSSRAICAIARAELRTSRTPSLRNSPG